ncbi:MAG: polyprenol monophosphomannose synthase [Anaerolineae bacterium]|nr:polyprenol monophosphomannose synthase [Anaerolineae bacterium]
METKASLTQGSEQVIVIVPTYNEAENIVPLVSQVFQQKGVDRVVIVDDCSPDGTGQVAEGMVAREPNRVSVVHRAGKLGLGTAYIAGFRRAFDYGATRVITMDADFSHQPSYIPAMLRMSKSCDLVIGSRYVPGGGSRNWGISRRVLSRSANAIARITLGLAAHDCTAGFRCYDSELLQLIDLDVIRSNGYSFLVEMLFLCQKTGASVGEVPIIFEDRHFGRSKISYMEILKAWQTIVRLSAQRLRGWLHPDSVREGV